MTVVSPFIAEAVGDIGRPRSGLPPCEDLDHLPGDTRFLAGILNIIGLTRRGIDHLTAQRAAYGGVYRTKFGPSTVVCICDPDLLVDVARNDHETWSAALAWLAWLEGLDMSSPTLDMSVTLDFAPHREVRKLLQPALSPSASAGYLAMAEPLFERAVETWVANGRVDFKREIRRLLANVSSRTMLGIDDDAEGARMDRALADVWRAPFALSKNRWLSTTWRRATNGHRELRETFLRLVPEKRKGKGEDLFSRICREPTDSTWLDDAAMVRVLIGTLIGAFDTTASAMASMAYLLAKNPEWQERLRAEAIPLGAAPSLADVKSLEATEIVWKETLRLFPVSSHLPRYALRDVELRGHHVPAGSFVWAMIGPLLQDPDWWTAPNTFDPERFTASRAEDKRHKGIYLPFGAGAHACLGMHLAAIEAKAFWQKMLTKCRLRLETDYDGHHTYTPLGVVSGDVALVLEAL